MDLERRFKDEECLEISQIWKNTFIGKQVYVESFYCTIPFWKFRIIR